MSVGYFCEGCFPPPPSVFSERTVPHFFCCPVQTQDLFSAYEDVFGHRELFSQSAVSSNWYRCCGVVLQNSECSLHWGCWWEDFVKRNIIWAVKISLTHKSGHQDKKLCLWLGKFVHFTWTLIFQFLSSIQKRHYSSYIFRLLQCKAVCADKCRSFSSPCHNSFPSSAK